MERPRKVGAKFTNKMIAPDEKMESIELDYDGKRDRWKSYDTSKYSHVQEIYEKQKNLGEKLDVNLGDKLDVRSTSGTGYVHYTY